nr:hypothetical transcript [Hymenolepis microstoma]
MPLPRANDIKCESVWKEIGDVCRTAIRCEKVDNVVWNASFSPIQLLCSFGESSEISKLYEAVVKGSEKYGAKLLKPITIAFFHASSSGTTFTVDCNI